MFDFKLRTKITIIMSILMSLVIVANAAILGLDFTKRYTAALESGVAIVAEEIRRDILKDILSGKVLNTIKELDDICTAVVEDYADLGYAMIVDPTGVVIFHSNPEMKGEKRDSEWIEEASKITSDNRMISKRKLLGSRYVDITLPLFDKGSLTGYVSVGMGENVIVNSLKHSMSLVTWILVLSIIFIAVMSFVVGKMIVRPLNSLKEMVKEIAMGEGDLTRRLNITTKDEIGEIGHWFDQFTENNQNMIRKFKESIAQMLDTAMKISSNTSTVSEGADAQYSAAEKNAASIDEMNKNFVDIASNIENLSSTTEEASSSILEMAASIVEVAGIAENVSETVDVTSSSIEEMMVSTKEVAVTAEELSVSADSTITSIGDISASINEVEKSAKDSTLVAQETASDAEKGMLAVEKTIEGMNKIKISVDDAAGVIKKLLEKSTDIGEILNVIDEIAEQTNLLALNAAIIAAQAGDHGKSFAVVADEIKDLSERTASSTKEIASLINAVQNESKNAVKSMEIGSQSVSDGVDLSQEAGESLEKILQGALTSKDMINQISKATADQLDGSRKVRDAMENVNHLIMRIAKATQEQSKGSEQIIAATESMKDSTNHVKRATQEQSKGGKQITQAIENITNMSNFVNMASQEQAKMVVMMVDSIDEIKKLSDRYGTAVGEMNSAVDSLISQTEMLGSTIADFKV